MKEIVEKYHWLSKPEFLDVLGVAKLFPGAISIKYATYTGYKMGGIPGAIVANVGNLLAPAILALVPVPFRQAGRQAIFLRAQREEE